MLQILIEESALRNWFPDPQIVLTDFEKATINAVKATFGNHITIRGCFYHLTQSTHRKIQNLRYEILYRTDVQFHLFCSMVDGLAFLPLSDLPAAINLLIDKVQESHRDAEKEILDYFDATYVIGPYRTAIRRTTAIHLRRVPSQFPPQGV